MVTAGNRQGVDKHVHAKTYVLTCDLGEKVQSLRNIGLKTPSSDDSFFGEVKDGLTDLVSQAMPGIDVYPVSMPTIVADILSTAQNLNHGLVQDNCIVSTCIEITAPMRGRTIDINRLVDINGDLIGLGPRPGCMDIDSQVKSIVAASKGKSIVIVEDGSFTGSTIVHTLEKFREHDKQVSAVVLGLMFPKAEKKIRENFDGKLIVTEKITKEIVDWMPDHDFFPWIPNCGRVLGHRVGKQLFPIYTHNGYSFSIPYILPFGPIDKWASIEDPEVAKKLSHFSIKKTAELFEMIEKLNGRKITTKDFRTKKPVVSIPYSCGEEYLPEYDDVRILDHLKETAGRPLFW